MAEPTRLRVAGRDVGVVGLLELFREVAGLDMRDDTSRRWALLDHFARDHHVPASCRADYAAALWRAYRAWRGESFPEEEPAHRAAPSVAVLGPGCPACERLLEDVRQVLAEAGVAAEVDHVKDREVLLTYGLVAYPALVVDGVVHTAGRRPTRDQLREIIGAARG
jgi:small redox-active disulfide protein 2